MHIHRMFVPLLLAAAAGCALMPPPPDEAVGVGGRTIELPSPPGLVSTPADYPGMAVRNAELEATGMRPLRHFLRHEDHARTRSGLAPTRPLMGYAAVVEEMQDTMAGREAIAELREAIEHAVARGPEPEPPGPEQLAAWHRTVDPNLTVERISVEPTALVLADHGPEHVCSLTVTRQETTVSAIPYYTFFQYYSGQNFTWYECWTLVRGRLLNLVLTREGDSERLQADLAQRMAAWLEAVRAANARPEPRGAPPAVQNLG